MQRLATFLVCLALGNSVFAANEHYDRAKTAAKTQHYIGGSVSRTAFTRAVVNHEPIDKLTQVKDVNHIYFFSELKGLMGETVFHRWEYNGEVVAEMKFEVGGPRWRIWSSRTLLPEWLGKWKVYVVDISGRVLQEAILDYLPR